MIIYEFCYCFVENGIVLFMWIGLHVNPEWLQQVFGIGTIGHVDIEMVRMSLGHDTTLFSA